MSAMIARSCVKTQQPELYTRSGCLHSTSVTVRIISQLHPCLHVVLALWLRDKTCSQLGTC